MEKGRVYEMVYLTEEEKIMVDAHRSGAKVDIHFHLQTEEEALQHFNELPDEVFPIKGDASDKKEIPLRYWALNHDGSINLNFYVMTGRKGNAQ